MIAFLMGQKYSAVERGKKSITDAGYWPKPVWDSFARILLSLYVFLIVFSLLALTYIRCHKSLFSVKAENHEKHFDQMRNVRRIIGCTVYFL